jgi:endogenous inhibitor of DNA gyrase (YacG/DUF329 family)
MKHSGRIESVSCAECGGIDVSDSPNSPFPPFCWDCSTWVAIIIRTVN